LRHIEQEETEVEKFRGTAGL